MPTLSVFMRKDDVAKWKAIPNKSEFIHQALNVKSGQATEAKPIKEKIADVSIETKVIKTKQDAQRAVEPLQRAEPLTYTKAIHSA